MKALINNQNFKTITFSFILAFCAISVKPAFAEDNRFVPEIGWNSRLSSMGLDKIDNVGKQYRFECQAAPQGLIHAPIWGSGVYTPNSGICSTAVHSGMISPKAGGKITVKLIEGQEFYTGSQKNNVFSQDHRDTELSYIFIDEKSAQDRSESSEDKPQTSEIGRILKDSLQRGVERSIENAIIDIFN